MFTKLNITFFCEFWIFRGSNWSFLGSSRPKINFCNCGFGHFRLTRVEVLLGRPPLFYFTGFLVERSLGDIEESHNELEVNVLGFCGMNVFT
jgi:hypothetical protein